MASNGTITKHTSGPFVTAAYADAPLLQLLTAMGHGNGSGPTEEFINLPSHSKTYNVANFGDPADTTEVKANLAITAGIAAGIRFLWFPLSMLPYDASLVNHATATAAGIRCVREGQGDWDVCDPIAYGANWAGSGGNAVAVQAAADAATGTPTATQGHVLHLPVNSSFTVEKPIIVKGPLGIVSEYDAINSTTGPGQLSGTFAGGPVVLVCGTSGVQGLTTSLLTGTGNGWTLTHGSPYTWFNLRDLDTLELNGKAALTVDVNFKGTTSGSILASAGRIDTVAPQTVCFSLIIEGAGRVQARLTTSGGSFSALTGGSAITDNTDHHIRFSYDGSKARVHVDGIMVASTAITGTLQQGVPEDVPLGATTDQLEQQIAAGAATGVIDRVRIYSTAHATDASFTPPTDKNDAVASDSLFHTNFEQGPGTTIIGYNKNGTCYLPQRMSGSSLSSTNFYARNILIGSVTSGRCGGIFLNQNTYNWSGSGLQFSHTRFGLYAPAGNAYGYRLERVYLNGNLAGRYGIFLGSGAGIGVLDTIWTQGVAIHLVHASSGKILNHFLQADSVTYAGWVHTDQTTSAAPLGMERCTFNTELGVPATFRAPLIVTGIGQPSAGIHAIDCVFENGNNVPFVEMDLAGVTRNHFEDCAFRYITSASSVMKVIRTVIGQSPVIFENCEQNGAWEPWSDVAGMATVLIPGHDVHAFAATPTFDAAQYSSFELGQQTADMTALTLEHLTPGQPITIQGDANGHNWAWPGNVHGGGVPSGKWSQTFKVRADGDAYATGAIVTGL